jgi:hypothetical protein
VRVSKKANGARSGSWRNSRVRTVTALHPPAFASAASMTMGLLSNDYRRFHGKRELRLMPLFVY